MPTRDIVVIGASAGGVETVSRLVGGLPEHFPAALFVVMHFPSDSTSVLPRILSRAGPLEAVSAEDAMKVEPGRIYCAPPGFHLLFSDGVLHLTSGPRENGHRPAIDPTMRSAAAAYGARVIGVVLSGMLDDGTHGLSRIKAHGGLAVVQSPGDALFAGMPSSALANVQVDYVAPLADLPELLSRLTRNGASDATVMKRSENGNERSAREETPHTSGQTVGPPSEYTCPECHGTLYEAVDDDPTLRFRCRVGHAYTSDTLVAEQTLSLEAALYVALRSLKESAALSRQMAGRCTDRGQRLAASRFDTRADDLDARAELVHRALERFGAVPDPVGGVDDTQTTATA